MWLKLTSSQVFGQAFIVDWFCFGCLQHIHVITQSKMDGEKSSQRHGQSSNSQHQSSGGFDFQSLVTALEHCQDEKNVKKETPTKGEVK